MVQWASLVGVLGDSRVSSSTETSWNGTIGFLTWVPWGILLSVDASEWSSFTFIMLHVAGCPNTIIIRA